MARVRGRAASGRGQGELEEGREAGAGWKEAGMIARGRKFLVYAHLGMLLYSAPVFSEW